MLNIGRLALGGEDYYLGSVARGADEYYTGAGEAPGYWLGSATAPLGLTGRVEPEQLRAVFARALPGIDAPHGRQVRRQTAGFDVTLRAPKSVSLLWALGDPTVAAAVRAAHDAAVTAAIDYLETTAAATRRGHAGCESVAASGFVAAAFRHRTSRAGDMLLHTHVVIANAVVAVDDGRWRSLDARLLYRHGKTAGYVYQCQLRHELTRSLGVRWTPVRNGYAEIDGIPRPLIDAFSQRRRDIVAELDRRGATSAKAAQIATLTTRPAKDRTMSASALAEEWAARSTALGFPAERFSEVVGRTAWRPLEAADAEAAATLLAGPHGLTQRRSSFTRADVVRGWCEQLPAGAPLPQVLALADAFLAARTGLAVPLDAAAQADPLGASAARWSTPELLAIETRLVQWATSRTNTGVGVADAGTVADALRRRPTLTNEQRAMVTALCASGDGVSVVRGKAGAGKTYALDAARDAWTASGMRVIGAALAARAAAELTAGAGIDAYTVAGLLRDLDNGHPLPPRTVLVCDESAMLGTRDLARLCAHVAAADAKVVLVGDDRQLASIDAGGAFTALARRLPVIELTNNRRQTAGWERDALDLLRDGHADRAIAAYAANDRVTVADTAADARAALIADWNTARHANGGTPDGLILAARHVDVADLNARARACLESRPPDIERESRLVWREVPTLRRPYLR